MKLGRHRTSALGLLLVLALASCSSNAARHQASSPNTAAASKASAPHAVGITTETFVDTHRVTHANGPAPQLPQRTLVTTIVYPAQGTPAAKPIAGAPPDQRDGPYPLIAFSHGTGTTPETYLALLTRWAEAGYVVVAPKFPLSSQGAPGGVDVGDVSNQPADVSFVINSVVKESAAEGGTLAGLVDPHEIGAAGHSLGAITTIGLVGNTCCQNPLIKAAIIMAGNLEGYPNGRYDEAKAPPLFVISGTDDSIVPYNEAVQVFNEAKGPKALLAIKGGDHGSSAGGEVVLNATTDFFDSYLKNSDAARKRLAHDGHGDDSLTFVQQPGSTVTASTLPEPELKLHATATPSTNLHDGQVVTVQWSGYTPGKAITILQCTPANRQLTDSQACGFAHAALLHPNPTGEGSLQLTITEGPVGTGTCDAAHPGCFILVDNASSSDPAKNVFIPITFTG